MAVIEEIEEEIEETEGTEGTARETDESSLTKRKWKVEEGLEQIEQDWKRYVPSGHLVKKWILPNTDANGKKLSPNGAINVMILMFFLFGILVWVWIRSIRLCLLIFVPLLIYTVSWMMYPLVEPSEGAEKATEIMTKNPHLKQAQLEGCEVYYQLSRNASKSQKEAIIDAGAVDCCLEAAFTFYYDKDIVARVVAVLGHLASIEQVSRQLIEDGAMELALLWLQEFSMTEIVCKHTLVFITTLLKCQDLAAAQQAKDAFVASRVPTENKNDNEKSNKSNEKVGLVETICKIMDIHVTITRTQQWGCVVFFDIATELENGPEVLYRNGAVEQVTKAMLNHPNELIIQQVGVGILASCLTKNPSNPMFQAIFQGLVDKKSSCFQVVEQARQKFPKVDEIQLGTQRIMVDCRSAFA